MKIRLKDIAAATGFSVNTVSHALRDMPDIGKSAKEKIRAVAAEMEYIPNLHASGFKSGKSGTIAVIFPDIINPHFTRLFHEIESFFQERSVTSLFLNSGESAKEEERLIRVAIGQNVDGVILCPVPDDDAGLSLLRRAKIPFVLLGRRGNAEDDCVICDDEASGYLAARYLLDAGHRKPACVRVDTRISSDADRYAGFCRALREAGVAPDSTPTVLLSARQNGNEEKIAAFFAAHPDCRGIFAFSDFLAAEFFAVAARAEGRLPADLTLVGCDRIAADYLLPFPLPSVAPAGDGLAAAAARLLDRRMNGDTADYPLTEVLPVRLFDTKE